MNDIPGERFRDKVVVVTAAGAGIGKAVADRFAREGAFVAVSDINPDIEDHVFEGRDDGKRHYREIVDVSKLEQVSAHIENVATRYGKIDVLVNNAGLGSWGYVHEMSVSRWHQVMAVTLDSVFFTARCAMPHLLRSKGNIVNTASISGLFADNGFSAYNAAKAAVINLTRTLALDHAKDGVRVNAICPGLTETPRIAWMRQTSKIMEDYDRRLPMGRAGTADEMAAVIAFLASAEASYVNGVAIPVDGGLTATAGQPMFRELLPERSPT